MIDSGMGTSLLRGVLALVFCIFFVLPAHARSFAAYNETYQWSDVFPDADRFGEPEGQPPIVTAYRGDTLAGYVFLASDVVESIGYSGKPIKVLVGLDLTGKIVGTRLVEHHEPILLVGIPEQKLFDFVSRYPGLDLKTLAGKREEQGALDAISGATVTAIVVDASIERGAFKVAKLKKLAGFEAEKETAKAELAPPPFAEKSWQELLEQGMVRRMTLDHG